jgi:predicted metal-dependent hydrolase
MQDEERFDREKIGPQRGKEIRARKMGFVFDEKIPRHWWGGSPFATHVANGLNLLFPMGERFFVRAVRRYADRITDPELAEQIKGFIGQEVRHGLEHERFFEILKAQGYSLDAYMRIYEFIGFRIVERITPPKLRLSITVALEHFTATLARNVFISDLMASAHPVMGDLFRWHAAEEIEHKAVAFDVLRIVDDSYWLRMAGLAMGTSLLLPFWFSAAWMLMAQDLDVVPLRALLEDRKRVTQMRVRERRTIVAAVRDYMRRDFHPSQNDDAHFARSYFERRNKPS